MNRAPTLFMLAAALVLLNVVGCGKSDSEAWQKAQQADTPEAYRAFLQTHPKGNNATKARDALDRLLTKAWQKASAENKEQTLRDYLAEFPTDRHGRHTQEVREKLESLLWDKVKQDGKVENYAAYVKEFPQGRHAWEAHPKLVSLKWEKAQNDGTAESLAAFLQEFPNWKIAWEKIAWEKIEAFWEQAKNEGKLEVFYVRLKEYPEVVAKLSRAEKFAPACDGKPIPGAPALHGPGPHSVVLLTEKGIIHEWHDKMPASWRTEKTESTPLVLVIGKQQETVLGVYHYTGPSITRYQYDLHVRLVEAKSGKVLATKPFQNVARPAYGQEPYHLTRLGEPVTCAEVETWLRPWVVSQAPTK